eukprot:TRINITY_DN10108_c0_g2_i1.p1 TRINITY_DN10108_c0_g2~~TRINITY_DN10108_c0_g2_i1.p1  ORF type:complete len:236 (+),score=20.68 TRINITY_DN10108_c0_g2_i1:77-784(+)
MIVIVMGVSGSGKSTIGMALASKVNATFLDADDFHSDINRAKMASGIPLTDDDRAPWLADLSVCLGQHASRGASVVLACSALKQRYRTVLRAKVPFAQFRLVCLSLPPAVVARQLSARAGHFMPPTLLDSQIAALEAPTPDEAPLVLAVKVAYSGVVERRADTVDDGTVMLVAGGRLARVAAAGSGGCVVLESSGDAAAHGAPGPPLSAGSVVAIVADALSRAADSSSLGGEAVE